MPGAKFTKHRKTNLRQCYDIQVYDGFTIKRDLQKNCSRQLRETCDKMYDSPTAY